MAVKSTADIAKWMDMISAYYTKLHVTHATELYKSMIPFMKLDNAKTIVESGCGEGNGVRILLDEVNENS